MQPIFNELLMMWKDLGYDLPLKEGIFWLDNNFIKAFTKSGEEIKLYKYKVYDDLHIEITEKTNKISLTMGDFETWQETLQRNNERLTALEQQSLSLIKQVCENDYKEYEKYVLTSTGKDSMVTVDLVHRLYPKTKVVFNNTSLDCIDTYKMVAGHKDWIITNPAEGFYQWCKRMNFTPTRFSRGCCSIFKEGNMINAMNHIDKAIWFMGVRNDESVARADREDITHNPKWGNRDWYGCLPIRKWSEFDIWLYIIKYNIETNRKYKMGYQRCGCAIACPYATKYTWVLDQYWYKRMRNRWLDFLHEDFVQGSRWHKLNCTLNEYELCWNGGIYRPEPTDEVIDEFMQYKGFTDRNLALQYFNKICCDCGKNVRQSNVLAMNLKLSGRDTNKIYCKKCLQKKLNMSNEEWNQSIDDFKIQGCELF